MRTLTTLLGAGLWLTVGAASVAAEGGLEGTILRADPDRLCAVSGVVQTSHDAIAVVGHDGAALAFGFEQKDGTLVAARSRNLSLGAIPDRERPRAVGAVTRLLRYVAFVGSHARRTDDCTIQPERERMLFTDLDAAGTAAKTAFAVDDAPALQKLRDGDEASCLQDLFTIAARPYPATRAFCRTIVAAEHAAGKDACPTFAIAGAAPLFEDQRERLWLGLGGPLVDGKAVLVRLARIDALRFDALALVDLGGEGLRGLAAHGRALFAIAGSAEGGKSRALWKLTPKWEPEAYFAPTLVRADLPSSAASMLSAGSDLVVIASGTADAPGAGCTTPARQYRIPLD